jgi:hypothetical protein
MIITAVFGAAQGNKGPSASFDIVQAQPKTKAATFTMLNNQPAVMIVLPYAPATVISAMQEYEINCLRSKKKQSNEYVAFDKTALMRNNNKDASLTFNVGTIDLEQKEASVVYLLLNARVDKGDDAGTIYRFRANDAIDYMNNLVVAIEMINLDRQIKAYTANVKKEERLQKKCINRCDKLSNQKEAIQQKLAQQRQSAINKDRKISLRLTESQHALALHKANVEKQRTDLQLLNNQKKGFTNK